MLKAPLSPFAGCIRELQANALSSRICDGIIDCPDFSDEKDCAYCREGHVHCGLGTMCIPRAKRCDGKIDCPSGSDEKDCREYTYPPCGIWSAPVAELDGSLGRVPADPLFRARSRPLFLTAATLTRGSRGVRR